MKQYTILLILFSLAVFACARHAEAQTQTVPNVQDMQQYSIDARYMSLPGFMRWQYYQENNVWISQAEAQQLVNAQGRKTNGN